MKREIKTSVIAIILIFIMCISQSAAFSPNENYLIESSIKSDTSSINGSMVSYSKDNDTNIIDFDNIIHTKIKKFLPLFIDTSIEEKRVSAYDVNPDCKKYEIRFNINQSKTWRFENIFYKIIIEIEGIKREKNLVVGLENYEISFPFYLEEIEQGEIVNVIVQVENMILLPIFHVPIDMDINPDNNLGTCTFFIGDFTPPTLKISKPEKAIYVNGKKVVRFFNPVTIGNLNVEVIAFDNESGIHQVDFILDGFLVYSDASYPYSWFWIEPNNHKLGHKHCLRVIAYDNSGNMNEEKIEIWSFLTKDINKYI